MMQDDSRENPQKAANCDQIVAPILNKPIVLVGMMGTGKTQLGRALAKELSVPFVDCDAEFETACGSSISDYFARYGEDAFRAGEFKIMDRLLDGTRKIISAGGGAVVNPETRAAIKARAITIWLTATPKTLAERCAGNDKRPLLNAGDPETILRDLLVKREPLYKEVATFSVDTETSDTLGQVLKGLKSC